MSSGGFSKFLYNLYTVTIFIIFMLVLEVADMIKSMVLVCTGLHQSKPQRPAAMSLFLEAVGERIPVIQFEDRSRVESVECAVCISELKQGEEIRELPCKHVFHKDCLDRWLEHKWAMCPTCPFCRNPVRKEETEIDDWRDSESYGGEEPGLICLSFHGSRDGNIHRLVWGN